MVSPLSRGQPPHLRASRKKELDGVIINSFGFGGANTTLVLKRYED